MDFDLEFESPKTFELEFESSESSFDLNGEDSTLIPVCFDNDHRLLSHREEDDQHPIGSITGLQSTLDNKADSEDLDEKLEESDLDEIENQEILYLWNKLIK